MEFSTKQIKELWNQVEDSSGGTAGPNGLKAVDYLHNKRRECKFLRDHINAGDYHFGPMRFIPITNRHGNKKTLAIGNFPDRVVYAVIASCLARLKDVHPQARAFREKIPMHETVKMIQEALTLHPHYFAVDIHKFFPSIPDQLIESTIERLRLPSNIKRLLMGFNNSPRKNWIGLPMGVAFVPALTNHIMYHLDETLSELAPFACRYADDIVLCFDSAAERDRVAG